MASGRTATSTQERRLIGGFDVLITRKRVRNINLRIGRDGSVRVSASPRESLARIEAFVEGHRDWIMRAQERQSRQQRLIETTCDEGSCVTLWGQPLTCHVIAATVPARNACLFAVQGGQLLVQAQGTAAAASDEGAAYRQRRLEAWLREQLRAHATQLLPHLEQTVGKRCTSLRIRNMKSRWGSCNVTTGAITLSAQLVHYPPSCLSYVLTHELCHLHEPSHNARFHALMDRFCPDWRELRAMLNGL